jgi:hypothetical protein
MTSPEPELSGRSQPGAPTGYGRTPSHPGTGYGRPPSQAGTPTGDGPSADRDRFDYESARRTSLLLLASGALPSAVGLLMVLFTLLRPFEVGAAGLGVPALVTGALMSLAMPAVLTVDALVNARLRLEQARLAARRTDMKVQLDDLDVKALRKRLRELE